MEKMKITINDIKLLCSNTYGYANSGVYPRVESRYYRVTDIADNVYTISTTKALHTGDTIQAFVKGLKTYMGEQQTALTRVSVLEYGPMAKRLGVCEG